MAIDSVQELKQDGQFTLILWALNTITNMRISIFLMIEDICQIFGCQILWVMVVLQK